MARPLLSLLGGFEYAGGEPGAAVLTRKSRAVVACLALQPGHTHSREKLAAMLWGGNTDLQARTNLRQALSAIRRAMPCSDGARLLAAGDSITLTLGDIDVDVVRFENLAAGSTPEQLEQAMITYRGDLLDGFGLKEESFEDWLRMERARLRAAAISVLEKLVVHYAARNRFASCVQAATRLLASEPLREDIHRALMRAYAAQDRVSLALKQYDRCRVVLQSQLRVQPEAETRELYEELRKRRMMSGAAFETVAHSVSPRLSGIQPKRPPTHYVKSGAVNLAYQVTGDGPFDMVYVPGWVSNLDYAWASPRLTHVLQRLGSFCRLIRIDKRGTGLSDRNVGFPTLEERMDDVRAVLDAVGSTRTVLFGSSEGGSMCMLFAAAYPERTAALVLNGTFARGLWSADYPWAKTREEVEEEITRLEREWGEPADLSNAAPSLMNDEFEREWFAAFLRNSASPADAVTLWRWSTKIDVRDILPTIHVPTLIIQRTGDRWVKVEEGRYLANRIAGAKYVELVGDDHLIWGADSDRLVDEMQTFLARPQPIALNERVLLVVLSAEIVGSPSIPASVGDHERGDWMQALDEDIRDELDRAEGREIKRTRGGLLAVFKRPTRALQCAMAIRRRVNASGLLVRAAVHIGECEVCGDDVTGSAIQTTSRLLDRARPGEIIASRTVRDIVIGSGLTFDARGEMKHDDAVGAWPFYSVGAPASETPQ